MCYAQMRKTRAFTLSNYKEFQLDRIKSVTISDNIAHLAKIGYLERIEHPKPPNKQTQYMYRITELGQHALHFVAAKERERFEKKMREHARINGKKGALKNFKKQSSAR